MTKKLSVLLLAFALVFSFSACSSRESSSLSSSRPDSRVLSSSRTEIDTDALWQRATYTEDTRLGQGEKTVTLTVTAGEKSVVLTISTDARTLGDALTENDLVRGEDSDYGLYVKTVNGIRADYDLDGYWWSLEQDGTATSYGVDGIDLTDGDNAYSFVYTAA